MTEDFRLRILGLLEDEVNKTQFLSETWEIEKEKTKSNKVELDLLKETERIFYELITTEEEALNPDRLKEALPNQFRLANLEQDALEFLLIYFDCLETKLKETQEKVCSSILFLR